jgi:hypothetical protein
LEGRKEFIALTGLWPKRVSRYISIIKQKLEIIPEAKTLGPLIFQNSQLC